MKSLLSFAMLLFVLFSCSDKDQPIGIWDDNIKLSIKEVSLKAQTDSVSIFTEGDWWWIDGITFNDSTYMYYNNDQINMEADSYVIKETEFKVERRNKNTLFILVQKNDTEKERKLKIYLQAGNYFDSVTITQVAN